jgi:hypothetical protein
VFDRHHQSDLTLDLKGPAFDVDIGGHISGPVSLEPDA